MSIATNARCCPKRIRWISPKSSAARASGRFEWVTAANIADTVAQQSTSIMETSSMKRTSKSRSAATFGCPFFARSSFDFKS